MIAALLIGVLELQDPSTALDLSGLWLFRAGDNIAFSQPGLDDDDWDQRRVPAADAPFSQRFAGSGWYRLHFRVTQLVADADMRMVLGPAREMVEVYVNGGLVAQRGRFGSRPSGGARVVPLTAAVPAGMLHAGDNVIAVRVYDPSYLGGLIAGPLWLGPPAMIAGQTSILTLRNLGVRIGFASLALLVALAHALLVAQGKQSRSERSWMIVAGLSLAIWQLSGVGVIEALLPSLPLALRLPAVASFVSVLGLGALLAERFGDNEKPTILIGRAILALLAAVALLAPSSVIFFAERPALLVASLTTSLYVAHLAAQAARRQERGALVLFAATILLAATIVYDALSASRKTVLPPFGCDASILLLFLVSIVGARDNALEYEETVGELVRLRKRLDDRELPGVLDTLAAAAKRPNAWLDVAVREAAHRLQVRRCSLILPRPDGTLYVAAAVGLPSHVANSPIADGSIAAHAFRSGVALTRKNLPRELIIMRRGGTYLTDAFVSHPVRFDERTLGVLNVSDKDDSSDFSAADEARIAKTVQELALLLSKSLAA